tara:strand:- start:420 stop:734 length:315 start_codon:yes stop_codon:yes gene_type:complete
MCLPGVLPVILTAVATAGIQSLFMNKQKNQPRDIAPEKPIQREKEGDGPKTIKDPNEGVKIKKQSKRSGVMSPESTTSDLSTPGISAGAPTPGGRQSPVGVQAP